ncbi:MAG TPA: DUF433 domain-containing protein [Polyangiaceae bacterium]|jgi:uncharacterized protein (DUF433 family)|nr:DUF433 domain-containing protein [Polyangiaceae bacterium]
MGGPTAIMEPAKRIDTHIDDTGDAPVVRGTRIRVSQIASETEHGGMTPDEVIEAHPHLSLADVHAALAFYFDNRESIRREWDEARALSTELQRKYPGRLRGR